MTRKNLIRGLNMILGGDGVVAAVVIKLPTKEEITEQELLEAFLKVNWVLIKAGFNNHELENRLKDLFVHHLRLGDNHGPFIQKIKEHFYIRV
jgi:ATP phosphoribosyltransferase regulatory subunit HisZ